MFKTYDSFSHRNINDIVPEIVYYYLFQGLSLVAFEEKCSRQMSVRAGLAKHS